MSKINTLEESRAARAALNLLLPVIVFDTETTGLKPKTDYIIEFSGMLFLWNGDEYEMVEQIEQYIKPPFPISKEITDITGITNEFLADKEDERTAALKENGILKFLSKGRVFVGQNLKFDIGMVNSMAMRQINREFKPKYVVDTLTIARELINKKDLKDQSYKLCNLAEYYMCSTGGFHNSTADIENTFAVLKAEMKDLYNQEEKFEKERESMPKDFKVYSLSRYKKNYGRTKRIDRMYINTNLGEVVYDFENGEFLPGRNGLVRVDPVKLSSEMNKIAQKNNFKNYEAVVGTIRC